MALMTVTTADKHIGEVWPKAVLRAQEFSLNIAQRVYREWKFAGFGDVYHVARIPNIETHTKAAGVVWTPDAYTDTEQTITINVHQVAGFEIEDIVKTLSNNDLEMEMRQKIGYSLGRAVETNLATLPQNFSQFGATVLGKELTYDDMLRAWRYLADAGIDMNDQCSWYFSPACIAGLLKLEIFINQLYTDTESPTAVQSAKIGNILGAPCFKSNLLRAPSAGQSESFLAFKQAMALIMAMEPKIVTEYRADALAMIVGGQQIYGYAEVDRYSETPGNVTATDEWSVLLKTVG